MATSSRALPASGSPRPSGPGIVTTGAAKRVRLAASIDDAADRSGTDACVGTAGFGTERFSGRALNTTNVPRPRDDLIFARGFQQRRFDNCTIKSNIHKIPHNYLLFSR